MRKTIFVFSLLATLLFAKQSFGQIDMNLVDIESGKTVAFSDVFETYNLDQSVPTVIITWSGKWCFPCIRLIERYNKSDTSMLNVITVNVDQESSLEDVLDEGYTNDWNNTINFHANLGEDKTGFDNVFNVSSAPLFLYIQDGGITDAVISYELYPYKLIQIERIDDIKFIWNSYVDLNSIAWETYIYSDDFDELNNAIPWVVRSMELNKNYNNSDTYAALLYKTGRYTKALKAAKEAIEIAKLNEEDYETTSELIQEIIDKL